MGPPPSQQGNTNKLEKTYAKKRESRKRHSDSSENAKTQAAKQLMVSQVQQLQEEVEQQPEEPDNAASQALQQAGQTTNKPPLLLCMLVCCSVYHCLSVSTCICGADLQQHEHCANKDQLPHPHAGTDRQGQTGKQKRIHYKIIDVTH